MIISNDSKVIDTFASRLAFQFSLVSLGLTENSRRHTFIFTRSGFHVSPRSNAIHFSKRFQMKIYSVVLNDNTKIRMVRIFLPNYHIEYIAINTLPSLPIILPLKNTVSSYSYMRWSTTASQLFDVLFRRSLFGMIIRRKRISSRFQLNKGNVNIDNIRE